MKKRFFLNTITGKISCMTIVTVLLGTVSVGLFSYSNHYADIISANARQATAVAQTVAAGVDAGQLSSVMSSGEKNEYWRETQRFISETAARTGITYLYILDSRCDESVYYFCDADTPGEETLDLLDSEPAGAFADEMFDAIRSGQPASTAVYDSEGFGHMVSGFAPILDGRGQVIGVVGADLEVEHVLKVTNAFGANLLWICLGACVIYCVISMLVTRHMIGRRILSLTGAAGRIALGDMDVHLRMDSRDEIGALTGAFQQMADATREQIQLLERVADGDLTVRVSPRGEKDAMSFALQRTVETLSEMLARIRGTAEQVSMGASQIAYGAQALANGVMDQSAATEELSAAMEQVAEQARHNDRLAGQAASLAGSIRDDAQTGSRHMEQTIRAVAELDSAVRSVHRMIKDIEDISSQTNLLALNASVEAARAGIHGKGFAVVAEQVRKLALQSEKTVAEVESLITRSLEKAKEGVRTVQETGAYFSGIVEGIVKSSEIVGEIPAVSQAQSVAIEQNKLGIGRIVDIVQENSATAEESASACESLSQQAESLKQLVSGFRLR